MEGFRKPVGPLPDNVYWRRRLIVGLGVLAVVVIILLIIFRPGATDGETPPPSPTNSTTPPPNPTGEPTDPTGEPTDPTGQPTDPTSSTPPPSDVAACLDSQLKLEALTDSNVYQAGEQPEISFRVTNTGTADCSLNVGIANQKFLITSGSEEIWNSTHCDTDPGDLFEVLKPGVRMQAEAFAWDRTKSSSSRCNAGKIADVADATYRVSVSIGGVTSESVPMRILN